MHGQEKIQLPGGVGEELPGRTESLPPIIYGNQTPFGIHPESQPSTSEPVTLPLAEDQETQTVLQQSLKAPLTQTEELLPSRGSSSRGALETVVPGPVMVVDPVPQISQPIIAPAPALARITGSVPVDSLNIPHGTGCATCGLKTCVICCQPKCITRTILIPQYHTVWSSIFETRYRTKIKEESYTVEQEVEHQVPRVIQETVMVPEPRIRTFQDTREEEYQVPVEEPYSVIVRKPRQRMVPVEREETYRYPEEQEYTVMVPQKKIVTETKFETIVDQEIRQKKYTVEVEQKRKRLLVDYVEKEVPIKKRIPYTETKKIRRERIEYDYVNEIQERTVKEWYVDYQEVVKNLGTLTARTRENTRNAPNEEVFYVETPYTEPEIKKGQRETTKPVKQEYTVAVPYLVKATENYTVGEPYYEDVVVSWQSRRQTKRDVTRNYSVKIPYIENIPRQYRVKVPVQVMKKGKRTIPKQIPRTKYQAVKRDTGRWVTTVTTIPTYEIEADRCGCSTCCPKTRTVRKTVWQPNIVTSQIPYTVYETVKQEVPYEYPVLEHRFQTRTRMEPVTRFRTEPRTAKLTVFGWEPTTATKTVTVRKIEQIPKTRDVMIQKFRTEKRTRMVDISEYEPTTDTVTLEVKQTEPRIRTNQLPETFTVYDGDEVRNQEVTVIQGTPKSRDKVVKLVVRVPKERKVEYFEEVELTEYKTVTEMVKVQDPVPRHETYIVKVPEIRTKIEYVDVEKRVPRVVEKTITEMVPQKRTRTIYKTDVRTVTDLKPEIYFEDVKETFTRTVYKKKIRNEPVNRAEIYWVKVPKVLKKTIFQTVKRKIKRPALRRVPVREPYQVEVRIPRRVCTMVPHTITIPVEECCEHCTLHLPGVAVARDAWMEYGWDRATSFIGWIREEL